MNNWLVFRDPRLFIIEMVVIVCSIALHEFGHAISADRLGDDTPRRQGRVTLWPDKHFDPMGFLMMVLTINVGRGLGWGKPVQVNFLRLRRPRRDMMLVSLWGPIMNLILAVIAGLILRVITTTGHDSLITVAGTDGEFNTTGLFLKSFLFINLGLMFFNLIPIHPLDGSKILSSLLPVHQAEKFDQFVGQFGPILIMMAAFSGSLGMVIGPAVNSMVNILAGPAFGG